MLKGGCLLVCLEFDRAAALAMMFHRVIYAIANRPEDVRAFAGTTLQNLASQLVCVSCVVHLDKDLKCYIVLVVKYLQGLITTATKLGHTQLPRLDGRRPSNVKGKSSVVRTKGIKKVKKLASITQCSFPEYSVQIVPAIATGSRPSHSVYYQRGAHHFSSGEFLEGVCAALDV